MIKLTDSLDKDKKEESHNGSATDLKSVVRKDVWVRFLLPPPKIKKCTCGQIGHAADLSHRRLQSSNLARCTKIKVFLSVRLHIYIKRRCVWKNVKIVAT